MPKEFQNPMKLNFLILMKSLLEPYGASYVGLLQLLTDCQGEVGDQWQRYIIEGTQLEGDKARFGVYTQVS